MSAAAGQPFGHELVRLCAGFVLWSATFAVLYGGLSVGCRFGWDGIRFGPLGLDRALLLLVSAASSAAVAWLLVRAVRRPAGPGPGGRFMHHAIVVSTASALVSTIWAALPILSASTCT